MKTNILIPFILIVVIAFYGCSKKQAASESEKLPIPEEQAANETESLSNPDSEFDNWSFEDAYALAVLMKNYLQRYYVWWSWFTDGEPWGVLDYVYDDGARYIAYAPVIEQHWYDISKRDVLLKDRWFDKNKKIKELVLTRGVYPGTYAGSAASIIAFQEGDTPIERITILFSTDKWETWNDSYIDLGMPYIYGSYTNLDYYVVPNLSLTCPQGDTTGYLLVTFIGKDRHWKHTGGTLYRTKNLGKSWELASELPEDYDDAGPIFAYEDIIIAPTTKTFASRSGTYFSFYKSTDAVTWKRIELPMNPEKYKWEKIDYMSFDGNYGFVRLTAIPREGMRTSEYIFLVTRDRGETWALWNNNRNITVE